MKRVLLPLLLACASQPGLPPERAGGVRGFGRPPGMPIGTGAAGMAPALADEREAEPVPAEIGAGSAHGIEQFKAAPALPVATAAPCGGCVELQLDVSDINERDEFAIALGGLRLKRVVWTVLVNFNSDQLAVQPFIDGVYGKYTSLHVNTFPIGAAVEVTQELDGKRQFERKVQQIGLKVGSSGAWTGNQTMSVFVAALRIEGPGAVSKTFDAGLEGFEARTHSRNPRLVFHPLPATVAVEPTSSRSSSSIPSAAGLLAQ